jgi:hypothetical protein
MESKNSPLPVISPRVSSTTRSGLFFNLVFPNIKKILQILYMNRSTLLLLISLSVFLVLLSTYTFKRIFTPTQTNKIELQAKKPIENKKVNAVKQSIDEKVVKVMEDFEDGTGKGLQDFTNSDIDEMYWTSEDEKEMLKDIKELGFQ